MWPFFFFTVMGVSKKFLKKPEVALRLKSIGLRLASPTDIKKWCFQTDKKKRPILGCIQNDKTINYKTLKPEPGGLFCPKVFGKAYGKKNRRYKLGYVNLSVPLAHIWYLKGSPSYLSILLRKKRRYLQNVIYGTTCLSFSHEPFHLETQCLTQANLKYLYNFNKPFTKTSHVLSNHFYKENYRFYFRHSVYEMWASTFAFKNKNFSQKDLWWLEQSKIKQRAQPIISESVTKNWTKFWKNHQPKHCVQQIQFKKKAKPLTKPVGLVNGLVKEALISWEDRALFLENLNANLKSHFKIRSTTHKKHLVTSWSYHNKELLKLKSFIQPFNTLNSHTLNTFFEPSFQLNDLNPILNNFHENYKVNVPLNFKTFQAQANVLKKPWFQQNVQKLFQFHKPFKCYYGFKGKAYQTQTFFFNIYLQKHFLKTIIFNSKRFTSISNLKNLFSTLNKIKQRKKQRHRYHTYRHSFNKYQFQVTRECLCLARTYFDYYPEMEDYTVQPCFSFSYCYPHYPLWSIFYWLKTTKTLVFQKTKVLQIKMSLLNQSLMFPEFKLKKFFIKNSKTLALQIKNLKTNNSNELNIEKNNLKIKSNVKIEKNFFNFVQEYFSVLFFQYGCYQRLELNSSSVLFINFKQINNDKFKINKQNLNFQKILKNRELIKNQLYFAKANCNNCVFWTTEEEELYEPLPLKWEEFNLKKQLQQRMQKQSIRLKFYYDLPQRFTNQIFFNLCYVPLSCGYVLLPKPYVIQNILNSSPIMDTRVKPKGNVLPNPLGHKNFRDFLKKTFDVSIKKSFLFNQLKRISTNLCSEKSDQETFSLFFRVEPTKHRLSIKIPNQTLKILLQSEKDRVVYFILKNFCKFKDFKKEFLKSWQLKLTQQQKIFLPGFTKLCLRCLINPQIYKIFFEKPLIKTFSQKSYFQEVPFLSKWHFSYDVLKTYHKQMLDFKQQGIQTEKGFNNWTQALTKSHQLKGLELKRWKTEKFIFKWAHDKKLVLNTLISVVCHKIDLFTGFLKPTYSLQRKQLKKMRRPLKMVKELINAPYALIREFRLSALSKYYRYFGVNVWLKCFNLKLELFNSSVNLTQNLITYFNLKTKLIKAKTVRFLLLNRLFKKNGLIKPDLIDLTWLLSLTSLEASGLMDYDKLLYRRCALNSKKSFKPETQLIGLDLKKIFQTQTSVNQNRFYLVGQNFSWPFLEDFNVLVEFCNELPHRDTNIVPAYAHQCITFETPRTGAWAIQTLLKKFKARLTFNSSSFAHFNQMLPNNVMPLYYKFLTSQFNWINERVIKYQKAQEVLRLNFPKKLTNYFMQNKDSFQSAKYLPYFRQTCDRIRERLGLKQTQLTRRLKLIRPFLESQNNPAWLILNIVPILPPDLRPVLTLEDGQFAVSDLNRLYQQLIQRNLRLDRFYEDDFVLDYENPYVKFRKTVRMHYRLAQQALDALIDNGKSDSKAVLNSRGQPLKSLAEVLRGKRGRFRQNLLGKRVDYSGRSVIIVGPQLKVHQCGLPKEMALELFQPFIIRYLIVHGFQPNFTCSKQWIRLRQPLLWQIVEQVLQDRPILLNRAPTLHRLGIQAFQPTLVSGRAILLHPLVCSAFNADFDGDQMAVHVPLSYEACSEAWRLMWSCNSVFSPATGDPILTPTQDMVLGCYYLSTWDSIKHGNVLKARLLTDSNKASKNLRLNKNHISKTWFGTLDQVIQQVQLQNIELHQFIWLHWSDDFELQRPQPCVEFQIDRYGYGTQFYPDYHKRKFVNDILNERKENTWLKTTPGLILINQIFFTLRKKI